MKNINKVLTLNYSLCCVSLQYFVWERTYKHGGITFQTPFVYHHVIGEGGGGTKTKMTSITVIQGRQGKKIINNLMTYIVYFKDKRMSFYLL
jgi:hypothetical protein